MKRLFTIVIGVLLLSLSAGAQPLPPPMEPLDAELLAQARSQGTIRVIVQFAAPSTAGRSEREIDDAIKLTRLGLLSSARSGVARLVANSETWTIPYAALEVDAAALQALAATPGVTGIGLDVREYRHLESALDVVDVDDAHLRGVGDGYSGLTGEGWTVVALDDGIQATHPFFGNRIVTEACFSTIHAPSNTVSLCPNGQATQFGSGAANTLPACAGCTHGTHVMGIAIGKNVDRSGAAPGADGIMINVFSKDNLGEFSNPSDQIGALEYVKNTLSDSHKIASINISIGGGNFPAACDVGSDPTQQSRVDVINELTAMGIAVVISSGNDGYKNAVSRPGCITAAMTVSAVDDSLNVPSFSNVSPLVDFFAPGVNVLSSRPGSDFSQDSGTSMAAPFVAGAWAVLKQAAPNATVTEIKNVLSITGTPIDDNRAGGLEVDIPLIQIDPAIDMLRQPQDQVFNGDMEASGTPDIPDGWVQQGGGKLKCNKETKTFTPFGDCTMMLKVDETGVSKFTQNIDAPRGLYDDQLTLRAQVLAKNVVDGKLMVKINYEQGSKAKIKILLQEPSPSYDWLLQQSNPFVLNDTVRVLKLMARLKPGGKAFIDNVTLSLVPTPVDND